MKKILITLVIVVLSLNITAQRFRTVAWYKWSDPIAFQLSPSPLITGYGYYSDSFSNANNGVQYYEYAGEYYPINSWADYYYWYVNKYWYYFTDADLYEYYYWNNDDFGMARYIASKKYKCRYYPSRIYISFGIKHVHINRLYVNSPYIAYNTTHVRHLNRSIGYKKDIHRKYHKPNHKPVIVQRGVHRNRGNVYKPNRSNKNNHNLVVKNRTRHGKYEQKYSNGRTEYNNPNRRKIENSKREYPKNYQKPNHKQVVVKKDVHRNKGNAYKPSSNKNNNSSVVKNRTKASNYGQKYSKGKTGYNSSNNRTRYSGNQSSSKGKNNSSKTKSSKRK
ncbi:MAG: hypothetical protein ABFS35_23825 [Bacteroidota bacterium]